MIVIDDDYLTSDEDVIANLNEMSSRYVNPTTYAHMVSNDDFGRERLIIVFGDRMQPQPLIGRKILPHFDERQTPQAGSRTDIDCFDSELSGDQMISNKSKWDIEQPCSEKINAVVVQVTLGRFKAHKAPRSAAVQFLPCLQQIAKTFNKYSRNTFLAIISACPCEWKLAVEIGRKTRRQTRYYGQSSEFDNGDR